MVHYITLNHHDFLSTDSLYSRLDEMQPGYVEHHQSQLNKTWEWWSRYINRLPEDAYAMWWHDMMLSEPMSSISITYDETVLCINGDIFYDVLTKKIDISPWNLTCSDGYYGFKHLMHILKTLDTIPSVMHDIALQQLPNTETLPYHVLSQWMTNIEKNNIAPTETMLIL